MINRLHSCSNFSKPLFAFDELISAIVGLKLTEAAHIMLRICGMLLLVVFVSDKALHVSEKY